MANNSSGFVLAEALVVAVIVAILAAVAIPLYSDYVQSQKQDAVNNLAQAAALAANSYYRRMNVDPPDADALKLFLPDPDKYLIEILPGSNEVSVTEVGSDPAITKKLSYSY